MKIRKINEQTSLFCKTERLPLKKGEVLKQKGFTLFELLVSISIIAVLTAVSVVSFGGLNKKTRDARRVADLEKIRVALESARQIGNTYPVGSGNTLALAGFLDKWPVDPKGGVLYKYQVGASNLSYRLCALVELPASISTDIGTSCSQPFGAVAAGFTGYYMVTQP